MINPKSLPKSQLKRFLEENGVTLPSRDYAKEYYVQKYLEIISKSESTSRNSETASESSIQPESQSTVKASTSKIRKLLHPELPRTARKKVQGSELVNEDLPLDVIISQPFNMRSYLNDLDFSSILNLTLGVILAFISWKIISWFRQAPSMENLRFCDSLENSNGSPGDNCINCPDYGSCRKGKLICFPGFIQTKGKCESKETNPIFLVNKLVAMTISETCANQAQKICSELSSTFLRRKSFSTEEEISSTLATCFLKTVQRKKRLWKLSFSSFDRLLSSPGIYFYLETEEGKMAVLKESFSQFSEKFPPSNYDGIMSFQCPDDLIEQFMSFSCKALQFLIKEKYLVILLSLLLVFFWYFLSKWMSRRALNRRAEIAFSVVCERLKKQSLDPLGRGWIPLSVLREQVVASGNVKKGLTCLWAKVEILAGLDSRIMIRQELVNGDPSIVWEWNDSS